MPITTIIKNSDNSASLHKMDFDNQIFLFIKHGKNIVDQIIIDNATIGQMNAFMLNAGKSGLANSVNQIMVQEFSIHANPPAGTFIG